MRRNKLYSAIVDVNTRPHRMTVLKTANVGPSTFFGWRCPFTQRGEWPPGHYTLQNEVEVPMAEWRYIGTDACFRDPSV